MRILQKHKDTLEILCKPDEIDFNIGDYLVARDGELALLLQVIDVCYADVPGVAEDIMRDISAEEANGKKLFDPYNITSLSLLIREIRLVTAKIRGIVLDGKLLTNSAWLPNRFSADIERIGREYFHIISRQEGERLILLGKVGGHPFHIPVESLDGQLTIITGKKESGKSHMAKLLVEGLVTNGATVLVLDVNGEYIHLGRKKNGEPSVLARSMTILEPGVNFTTSPSMMGLRCFMDVLEHVYQTPPTSCREFSRVWHMVERGEGEVSLNTLIQTLSRISMNESVREALVSRLNSIEASGFVADDREPTELRGLLQPKPSGNLVVVNLLNLLPTTRRLVVEYLLSSLSNMLRQEAIPPLFLLAEEAHLYLRETYWEDIVTRMRHLGLFPIFVTNQPDTIPESVYRQADNFFLFNFANESDLERIARASRIDGESVKSLGRGLPPRHCLLVGRMVSDIPVVLSVRESELQTLGQTKLFFKTINRH